MAGKGKSSTKRRAPKTPWLVPLEGLREQVAEVMEVLGMERGHRNPLGEPVELHEIRRRIDDLGRAQSTMMAEINALKSKHNQLSLEQGLEITRLESRCETTPPAGKAEKALDSMAWFWIGVAVASFAWAVAKYWVLA